MSRIDLKSRKRVLLIIGLVTLLVFMGLKTIIFNNFNLLSQLAEGIPSNNSSLYFFVVERIYALSERKDIGSIILKNVDENKFPHLHDLYIRIVGVTGEQRAIEFLMNEYNKSLKKQSSSERHMIFTSLGLLGNEDVAPFLKLLLEDNRWPTLSVIIAQSLYLLTGDEFLFTNPYGEKQKLYLTKNLIEARKVILASKNRKRSFDDILVLDQLFRKQNQFSGVKEDIKGRSEEVGRRFAIDDEV